MKKYSVIFEIVQILCNRKGNMAVFLCFTVYLCCGATDFILFSINISAKIFFVSEKFHIFARESNNIHIKCS